jgi:hypothetical protein
MKINRYYLCLFFLITVLKLSAQNLKDSHRETIAKNILSYHFRYALDYDIGIRNENILGNDEYFFEQYWLCGERDLYFEIEELPAKYPLPNYRLYKILKRGFRIGDDESRCLYTMSSFDADDNYLIAYDKEIDTIKFLSGNFFISPIANDFYLDISNPTSFKDFLWIKLFNWKASQIQFLKKRRRKILFEAFSDLIKERILIEINSEDFDDLKVLRTSRKIVY